MRHEYQWRAYYENDSGRLAPTLDEYCAAPCVNGNHSGAHAFACIDQSRLIGLAWLAADGSIRTQVPIKPGAKAILFRRHKIEDILGVLGPSVYSMIHVIGWQKDGGQWLLAIMPDNRVVVTDDQRDLG
jgi:hypothetical protein